ncbi:type II secretion system F family protein [Laribacter hongkongensis]|uniref:Type II secretion system F family protein n=1 Tax=Laribacter hongkongensis TaxID=168471 RepID=A0ABD4SPM4_9NEIS|nr:type II secretion system F family protein [Laribacter hongkongensis]MBE5530152.1 hypothetical protein [Laribacter hongkongensis]MCG9024720.1 type II secretion system F family protein [Laribacter hongkongensis]MCG9059030.1 type II secretion system F family protein [Laribacter hongkongensis]MCG9063751.1 type II secretion system F family protein [Laribacter hongkongensis]MCG9086459.1 type II secretion system F family protein [Laribacter hongkongensis]
MTPVILNLLTLAAFLTALLLGLLFMWGREAWMQQPHQRVRQRLLDRLHAAGEGESPEQQQGKDALFRYQRRNNRFWQRWLEQHRRRLQTVASTGSQKILIVVIVIVTLLAGMIPLLVSMPLWLAPLLLAGLPLLSLVLGYRYLVARFTRNFLALFPNALDLIVRAVRAGVPVTRAVYSVSEEFPEPVRTEFRLMSDGLRLGIDMGQVLDEADRRIAIPDFSFFVVCLQLQRETGGQLTEMLENLSQIIRTRRELGMKARALTAEGRTASKVIAAVPLCIMLALWVINPEYIGVLFSTPQGHTILYVAAAMGTAGLLLINRIARLEA